VLDDLSTSFARHGDAIIAFLFVYTDLTAFSFQELQLYLHLCPIHLSIPDGRLDRKDSFHRDMPKGIGKLFKRPSCITSTMWNSPALMETRKSRVNPSRVQKQPG
jgi:hypothetical protein